jgi:hypothetical protein
MKYYEVQKIAKDTIEYIKNEIHAGVKLTEVRRLCEDIYTENGNTHCCHRWTISLLSRISASKTQNMGIRKRMFITFPTESLKNYKK